MSTLKNCYQIRTSRNIKGFRSCVHATATPLLCLDKGRISVGEAKRLWSSDRELWLRGVTRVVPGPSVSFKLRKCQSHGSPFRARRRALPQ